MGVEIGLLETQKGQCQREVAKDKAGEAGAEWVLKQLERAELPELIAAKSQLPPPSTPGSYHSPLCF